MLIPYDKKEPLKLWSCVFYQWKGHYMIHRLVGFQDGRYWMMGDGNLVQMEIVEESDILGVLQTIYRKHPIKYIFYTISRHYRGST